MRIADFDQRFLLEQPLETDDGAGGRSIGWTPLAIVWARVVALSGGEEPHAATTRSEIACEVVLRYRGELNATMRLSSAVRILEITAISQGPRPLRWPICRCREVPLT